MASVASRQEGPVESLTLTLSASVESLTLALSASGSLPRMQYHHRMNEPQDPLDLEDEIPTVEWSCEECGARWTEDFDATNLWTLRLARPRCPVCASTATDSQ